MQTFSKPPVGPKAVGPLQGAKNNQAPAPPLAPFLWIVCGAYILGRAKLRIANMDGAGLEGDIVIKVGKRFW